MGAGKGKDRDEVIDKTHHDACTRATPSAALLPFKKWPRLLSLRSSATACFSASSGEAGAGGGVDAAKLFVLSAVVWGRVG